MMKGRTSQGKLMQRCSRKQCFHSYSKLSPSKAQPCRSGSLTNLKSRSRSKSDNGNASSSLSRLRYSRCTNHGHRRPTRISVDDIYREISDNGDDYDQATPPRSSAFECDNLPIKAYNFPKQNHKIKKFGIRKRKSKPEQQKAKPMRQLSPTRILEKAKDYLMHSFRVASQSIKRSLREETLVESDSGAEVSASQELLTSVDFSIDEHENLTPNQEYHMIRSSSPTKENNNALSVLLDLELDSDEDTINDDQTKLINNFHFNSERCESALNSSVRRQNVNTNSGFNSSLSSRSCKPTRHNRSQQPQETEDFESDESCGSISDDGKAGKIHSHSKSCRSHKSDRRDRRREPQSRHRRREAEMEKQFCKEIYDKIDPNEIAVDVARRIVTNSCKTTRRLRSSYPEQSRCANENLNKAITPCHLKSHCSMDSEDESWGQSSRRHRSTSDRSFNKGSDRSDKRSHRPASATSVRRGQGSPGSRTVGISTDSKGNGKRKQGKSRQASATHIASASRSPSQGASATSINRGGLASGSKNDKSTRHASKQATSSGQTRALGQKSSKSRVGAPEVDGIVPLTPAEICERCSKYRMDEDIGDYVPLDFSHVQQLERLAETTNDESVRQVLKTVTAIIEERVCKQMYGYLMPCSCPGCDGKPNICESLEKFFGASPKKTDQDTETEQEQDKKKGGGKGKSKNKKGGSPKKGKGKDKGKGGGKTKGGESSPRSQPLSQGGDLCQKYPSVCYYDKGRCCMARCCPPRWNNYWTNSSSNLRLGWWPGARMGCAPYDRCWNNRSYNGLVDSTTDPVPLGGSSANKVDNSGGSRRDSRRWNYAHTDRMAGNTGPCFTGSWMSQTTRDVSEFLKRYGPKSLTPCPHETVPSGRNCYRNPVVLRSPKSPSADCSESKLSVDQSKAKQSSSVTDVEQKTANDIFDQVTENKSSNQRAANNPDEDEDNHLCDPTSDVDIRPHSRRVSPQRGRIPSASHQASPTTAVIGELEARTKQLLAEAKSGLFASEAGSVQLLGFSPIKPPDVNTAYSVYQESRLTPGASTGDVSDNNKKSDKVDDRQWWDGLPKNTAGRCNSLVFKKYNSSSALPVSVRAMNARGATDHAPRFPRGVDGRSSVSKPTAASLRRSRSEPRPLQKGSPSRQESRTPRSTQQTPSSGRRPASARKADSYTICNKPKQGKMSQRDKGKAKKKLWKY